MRLRITFLIPAVLLVSTLASSALLFWQTERTAEQNIRHDTLAQIALDISRLQNILYNRLTEANLTEAKLNLSVTAMDPSIVSLLLADENDIVLLANRYAWEGVPATQVTRYEAAVARKTKETNSSKVAFDPAVADMLTGYYPVILQLENAQGAPIKRIGVLYTEIDMGSKLATAYYQARGRAMTYGGIMLAVTLLVALILHVLVSRRLGVLTATSLALSQGNLDARARLAGNDELRALGDSFDAMADQIKQDIDRREDIESELRRHRELLEEQVADRTKALQEANQTLQTVLDTAPFRIFWKDTELNYLGCNHVFAQDAGINDPQNMIGKSDYDMAWKATADLYREDDARVIATGQAKLGFEEPMDFPDGSRIWLSTSKMPLKNSDGEIVGVLGTYENITERKHTQQALEAAKEAAESANKAKSEFLARMSHELRTPMNAILGFAQVLEFEELGSEQRSFVEEIHRAGDHLLELINELLDLSRIEAGKLMVMVQPTQLGTVVKQAVQIVQPMASTQQVAIVNHCEGERLVLSDATRLRQILVNFLSNAVKYNQVGGRVTLECAQAPDGRARLSVHDTGQGIALDAQSNLFKPFERLGAELSEVQGTGVGLALSKQLAELMGADVGATSSPGEGSVFWIDLPVASDEGIDTPTTATAGIASKVSLQHTVLYVEDNPANLRVVEAMFRRKPQLRLTSATNGEHGLELAKRHSPDVILLDIHLPGMDGYAVLEALKADAVTRAIPVIALSADAMPLDVERGLKAGFDGYLTKPVKVQELVDAVEAALLGVEVVS